MCFKISLVYCILGSVPATVLEPVTLRPETPGTTLGNNILSFQQDLLCFCQTQSFILLYVTICYSSWTFIYILKIMKTLKFTCHFKENQSYMKVLQNIYFPGNLFEIFSHYFLFYLSSVG